MGRFSSFVRSFDVFGEPVALNYDGDSSFKTLIGAIITIAIKVFILVFASAQTI